MDELRGKFKIRVPLALHTSWKVGGITKHCYQPADLKDLVCFLRQLPSEERLLWLGLGSNTLVRAEGFKGTVILLKGGILNAIQRLDTYTLRIEAGVPSPVLARWCAREGLTGLEFLAGIPGTIGGALAMNAGAYGSEIWDFVSQVETIDRQGKKYIRLRAAYQVHYRYVEKYSNEWFTAAQISLKKEKPSICLDRIRKVLTHRRTTQPNQLSAGSVFRNPQGDYAGRLIEQCGLKGIRLGGAMVSDKHANFIINRGHANTADIETLIDVMSNEVQSKYGVELVPEVCIYPKISDKLYFS